MLDATLNSKYVETFKRKKISTNKTIKQYSHNTCPPINEEILKHIGDFSNFIAPQINFTVKTYQTPRLPLKEKNYWYVEINLKKTPLITNSLPESFFFQFY